MSLYDDEFAVQLPAMFDERVSDDIQGLLYVGRLEDEVELYGHTFILHTLSIGDELEVGLLIKKFSGTVTQAKALATATVAAALQSTDGKQMVQPLGPGDMDHLALKFNTIRKWYWPLVEALFNSYQQLQLRSLDALEEFQSKSERGLRASSPSVDSLNDNES